MEEFTEWAQWVDTGVSWGQFGVPATDSCLCALDELPGYVGAYPGVLEGWAYRAGGPLWEEHPLCIEATSGEDTPHMVVLDRHLG